MIRPPLWLTLVRDTLVYNAATIVIFSLAIGAIALFGDLP